MKHIEDYAVFFHQKDEEWEAIAIIKNTINGIRAQITRLYDLWGYDNNEDVVKEINDIVNGLSEEGYFETEVDKFKIEIVPFYE